MDTDAKSGTAGAEQASGMLTTVNLFLARAGMGVAIGGLVAIVVIVFYQVFGRYVLNASPTWTENLALVLILYVSLIGAAVGVRDAGHVALDSLLVLLPERVQVKIEFVIFVLVGLFGAAMTYNGCLLGRSVAAYLLPNLHISEGFRYVPLVVSGVLIVLFSIEQAVALVKGKEIAPSWN
jgi:TRAP-type C4-dicarboxylate transport system permease small subunit